MVAVVRRRDGEVTLFVVPVPIVGPGWFSGWLRTSLGAGCPGRSAAGSTCSRCASPRVGLWPRSACRTAVMLTLTRQLYKWLIANGVVQLNPADGIPSTGKPADEATAFTAETLSTIRTHICGDGYEVGFPLTLCGLRRSELMGLTWEDMDSEAAPLQSDDHAPTWGRRVSSWASKDHSGQPYAAPG